VINVLRGSVLARKVTIEEVLVGFGHLTLGDCGSAGVVRSSRDILTVVASDGSVRHRC
jgi:hypothetical protein